MIPLRLMTYKNAPKELKNSGKVQLKKYFGDIEFDFSSIHPFILFFLSGGSESCALEIARHGSFYLLVGHEGNNSWAAATEVKAWMDQQSIDCILVDLNKVSDREIIRIFIKSHLGLDNLIGKKLGLIGEISDWLVASNVDEKVLATRLGIILERISWSDVPDWKTQGVEATFTKKYPYPDTQATENAGKVKEALVATIRDHNLDAITVECFSLVQNESVTACLALSDLNDAGKPAGCEGDLTSIAGMMFVQAVTGQIPWMANLVKLGDDFVRFAHCTAPTNLLDSFNIDTHYETGKGTAISGIFSGEEVTIFRLGNDISKGFLSTGKIITKQQSPVNACRTMVDIGIDPSLAELLKTHPLGNHHLILPGNHIEVIRAACRIKQIRLTGLD